jgi:hypothetical protein
MNGPAQISPRMSSETPSEFDHTKVVSPFAETAATFPPTKRSSARLYIWIAIAIVMVSAGGIGGMIVARHLSDPLRTLDKFPVAKYLENYRSVAGAKFKGDLRVEADLGWKEGAGRLMVFTAAEDTRPIVVLIPPHLSNIYFSKGQTYLAELEVKEGGLIYANTCRKH